MSQNPFSPNEAGLIENIKDRSEQELTPEAKLRGPPTQRTPARLGTVDFKFDDPAVEVTAESSIVEQETLDDQVVVQKLGSLAQRITIEGVVTEAQAKKLDSAPERSLVFLRTQRWTGDVLVESVNTAYRREIDREGNSLYDVSIEAIELVRTDEI